MADEIEWTPVKVKLGDLSHWADNPVTLTKAQAGKLLRSKEKLGKMQTLAIGPSNGDGKYPLYDGHQRANVWGAAFGMGLEVWALQSSRALTDEEHHAVPIMLRTAVGSLDWDALAGWDAAQLLQNGLDIDSLREWNADARNLLQMLQAEGQPIDFAEAWQGMPEFEQEDLSAFKSITVHFDSLDNLKNFAELVGQTITEKTKSIWYPKKRI